MKGSFPLQVIVATSPIAELFWDDNNGNKSSFNISGQLFPNANRVLLDDVALATNGTNYWAYISARVDLPNSTTDIVLIPFRWDYLVNQFQYGGFTIPLDNRPMGTDVLDGVRVNIGDFNGGKRIVAVWQKNDNILLSAGLVNMVSGNLNWQPNKYQHVFFQPNFPNPTQPLGNLSHPDVASDMQTVLPNSYGDVVISAIRNNNSIVVGYNYGADWTNYSYDIKYENLNTSKRIRSQKMVSPREYTSAIVFDELDLISKNSRVFITAGIDYVNQLPFQLNDIFERNCVNNNNYKLTGLPGIAISKLAPWTYGPNSMEVDVEVCWQQIKCAIDNCDIQTLTKRLRLDFNEIINQPNTLAATTPLFNNQYFHVNADLSKNSFFGSIAILPNNCQNFYAFDLMNKNTSINGQIAYKNSACTNNFIREVNTVKNNNQAVGANEVDLVKKITISSIYPNPSSDIVYISNSKGIKNIVLNTVTGKQILHKAVNYTNNTQLNVGNIPNGQYFVKVTLLDNTTIKRKIIINH